MLDTLGRSEIGTLYLDGPKITAMMNHPSAPAEFSTDSLREHLPVLYEKVGGNKDLNMELSWKDVKVLLGNYDADVILEYTMQLTLFEHENIELIYDEVRVITAFDLWTENDMLHAHFINWKLDMDSIRYASDKTLPIRNGMSLTANEYEEWLSDLDLSMNEFKRYMNEVIWVDGVDLPFTTHELYSDIKFKEKSLHVFLEVEDDAAEWFEEEWWEDY